jgi:hypothetical protein
MAFIKTLDILETHSFQQSAVFVWYYDTSNACGSLVESSPITRPFAPTSFEARKSVDPSSASGLTYSLADLMLVDE